MYRGFSLTGLSVNAFPADRRLELKNRGRSLFAADRRVVQSSLSSFVGEDGLIDGVRLREEWFPQIDAQVFISHSHHDEELALLLAAWLAVAFGLRAFVDSAVWGYAAALLREIDNRYCRLPKKSSYSYESRNHSTSHVHTILMTALGKMIDATECLMFLNTPQSITSRETIEGQTQSQWLFSELALTRIVRQRLPSREFLVENFSAEGKTAGLHFRYTVDLSQLTPIALRTLAHWENMRVEAIGHPLDALYSIVDPMSNGD